MIFNLFKKKESPKKEAPKPSYAEVMESLNCDEIQKALICMEKSTKIHRAWLHRLSEDYNWDYSRMCVVLGDLYIDLYCK